MPRIEAKQIVPVDVDTAFAISQTHGAIRLEWDPFVRAQHLVGGDVPAKGVRTHTTSRHRLTMVSEYVSYKPPHQVGMKMIEGPWFFASFGGGWTFKAIDDNAVEDHAGHRTEATWRYTFAVKPGWLAPIGDPIGRWLLGRDITARLAAYAAACENPAVLASVRS